MLAGREGLLWTDRSGSITVMMAVMAPVLLLMVGVGVEVSRWTLIKQQLQRTADVAALAGATEYLVTHDVHNAATAAADLIDLNGGPGNTARTWTAETQTLSGNQVTIQVGPGAQDASHTGVSVTVSQVVPLILTQTLTTKTSMTVSASAWAELSVFQPCLFSLGKDSIIGGISTQGNASITLTKCSVHSNANVSAGGGKASIAATSVWAGGTISPGVSGTLHPGSDPLPDPYANYPPVIAAFAKLSTSVGLPFSNGPKGMDTLSPGEYSGWDIKGSVTLNPGIYYVNGDILLGAQAVLSGTGVTIVTSGILKLTGGASIDLTAATNNSQGAIPGMVFAGNSMLPSSFGGNSSALVTGVIYYPNGALSFHGTPKAGSTGCLQVIAQSISLTGNSSMPTDCVNSGGLTFGDKNFLGLVK